MCFNDLMPLIRKLNAFQEVTDGLSCDVETFIYDKTKARLRL